MLPIEEQRLVRGQRTSEKNRAQIRFHERAQRRVARVAPEVAKCAFHESPVSGAHHVWMLDGQVAERATV
jgi:hypothetical protein